MKNQNGDTQLSAQAPSFSNEEALSIILDNLQDIFFLVDRQFNIITTSEHTKAQIQKYLGIPLTEGMSILDLVGPERRTHLRQLYLEVFEGKEKMSETSVMIDGKLNFYQHYFRPAYDKSGRVLGAVVRSRDITKEKEDELALKSVEERWRYALEGGKQGVWDWNMATGDVYFSPSCKKIYGYEDDEMANRIETWASLVHPEDRLKVQHAITEHVSSVNPYRESTYRIKTKQGLYKWVMARGTVIAYDSEGKPLRMIGTHSDISDQIRIEENIRISNDRYKHAILATSDVVWDWDLENNRIHWSDHFTRIMGWELPPEKILDFEFCADHFHPEDRVRVEKSMQMVINDPSKTNWQEELRYRKADGTYAFVTDRGYVIRNDEGKAIRMIGALQDITERKQNEQLLFLERRIFEMTARLENSFESILNELLAGLQKVYPEAMTSVCRLHDDQTIEHLVGNGLPDAYLTKLNGQTIGPSRGSCGTAMYTRETVIVEDIAHDPLWKDFKNIAAEYGLQACWSFPILQASGKVLGSFSIYYHHPKSPTYIELTTLERVRNMLRVLLEHNWSLNEIRSANERFDIMMRATHDLIWDWDLETNEIYRDELGLRKVYGISDNESIRGIYQWLARIHPEDQSRAEDVINDILQATHQDTFDIEYRFLRDDGTYSHVYDRGMIIRGLEGKPLRMIGAAQDVTERKRLEQELLQNELERQKAINQATVETQEQERSEIGKELHDNVNQVLTTTKLYLDLAQTNAELKDDLIRKSSQNIVSVINEIRQLSRSLMDPSIGDLGLIDSTYDLIENINLTRKLQVQLSANKELEEVLNKSQKLTVFRIIQEALNNAIKHAKATHVSITFQSYKTFFEIIIQDNGIGFEPTLIKKGVGLKNIQNRIYLVNGSHFIDTAPGKGCKIIINFPILSQ